MFKFWVGLISFQVALAVSGVGEAFARPTPLPQDRPRPGQPPRPEPPRRPPHHPQDPRRGHSPHKRKPLPKPIPRYNDPDDREAAFLVEESTRELDCERLGDAVRRLANRIMDSQEWVRDPRSPRYRPIPPGHQRPLPPAEREKQRQRWVRLHNNPYFWQRVWDHMTETYKACEVDCFTEGEAIGIISATGYCGVSVSLGGLDAPGFLTQAPLPLCENEIFAGCVSGYQSAAREYEGCSAFTTGEFEDVFREFQSQDCHFDM